MTLFDLDPYARNFSAHIPDQKNRRHGFAQGHQAPALENIHYVAWIAFEFLGIMLTAIMFGNQNLFAMLSIGILSAFGGYLLVRAILEKQPDRIDEDIDRIGSNDLRP